MFRLQEQMALIGIKFWSQYHGTSYMQFPFLQQGSSRSFSVSLLTQKAIKINSNTTKEVHLPSICDLPARVRPLQPGPKNWFPSHK